MERRRKIEQTLNLVVYDGDGGDPQPDGECPGLLGCGEYNPCPLKGQVFSNASVSSDLSREIARRVKGRLGLSN